MSKLREFCGPKAVDVMRITGLSDYELSQHILEEGWLYIKRISAIAGEYADVLNVSRPFWNWWKTAWYSHDCSFVAAYGSASIPPVLYLEYHRMRMSGMYPDRTLMSVILSTSKATDTCKK